MTLKKRFLILAGACAVLIAAMFVLGEYTKTKRAEKLIALCEKLDGATIPEARAAMREYSLLADTEGMTWLTPQVSKEWNFGPIRATYYSADLIPALFMSDEDKSRIGHATIVHRIVACLELGGRPLRWKTDFASLSTSGDWRAGPCKVNTIPF